MRQVFYLLLSLLVLRAFFPEVGERAGHALLAFVELAERIFTSASQGGISAL